MKLFHKKCIILMMVTILFVTSLCFASSARYFRVGEFIDDANTYTFVDLDTDLNKVYQGDLLVFGDSYAYLLALYSGYSFNYVVHPGYDVNRIITELIPIAFSVNKEYKYAYVFIGPNDFMEQTSLAEYGFKIQSIINELKKHKVIPIFSEYFPPDYKREPNFLTCSIKCDAYSAMLRNIVNINKCWFLELKDLYERYGYEKNDFVHPNNEMYRPIMDRLIEFIARQVKEGVPGW